MKKDLAEIIAIDTTQSPPVDGGPFGEGNKKALGWFLEKAKSYGLETGSDGGYCAWAEYGSGKNAIGILGHLDVVPAGTGWKTDPFVLTEKDGMLFGRGVSDDKGPVVACLHMLRRLKEEKAVLKNRVRLIVGFNEESGSLCIKHYVKTNEIPVVSFTPDADFPVVASEKGILHLDVTLKADSSLVDFYAGERPNVVPADAKMVIRADSPLLNELNKTDLEKYGCTSDGKGTVYAKGVAAHGATPEKGVNAAAILFKLLYDVCPTESTLLLHRLSKNDVAAFLGIDKEDESGKLTVNLGMVRMSDKKLVLSLDIRRPYSVSESVILEQIRKMTAAEISIRISYPPLFYSDSHPLVSTLLEVYRSETGDRESAPLRIGGGTYAKELPNCVGFGAVFPGLNTKMHEPDEFFPLDKFYLLPDIYRAAALKLDEIF